MSNIRQEIIKEARSWVPTPYRHQFMNKGIGCSCGLFIIGVFSNLGMIPGGIPPHYNEDWAFHNPTQRMPDWYEDMLSTYFTEIEAKDLKEGDLILYNFGKSFTLSHISILVENNMIIHSEKPVGVTLSNRQTKRWFKRERIYFTWAED